MVTEVKKIIHLSSILKIASKLCTQYKIDKYVTNIGGYRWEVTKIPDLQLYTFYTKERKYESKYVRTW